MEGLNAVTRQQKHNSRKSFLSMDRPDMTKQYQQMADLSPSTLLERDSPNTNCGN